MASMEPCSRLTETLSELEAAQKRALIVQKRVQKAGERVEQVKVLAKRLAVEKEEVEHLGAFAKVYRRIGKMLIKTSAEEEQREVKVKEEEAERQLRVAEAERETARQEVHLLEGELNDLESREATASLTVAINGLLKTQPSLQRSARWLCFSIPTSPILQEGPQCGLVSLTVAINAISKQQLHSVATVFQLARERGFSKQGEMFSVDSMASLAEELLPEGKVSTVEVGNLEESAWLVAALLDGSLMLVPYDCTPDHSPGLAGGQKAHWALVTGFLLPCPNTAALPPFCFPLPGCPSFYELSKNGPISPPSSSGNLILVARQSKSVLLGLWPARNLVLSCKNLRQAASKRLDGSYVLPEGGSLEKLCGRIVILSKNKYQ